MKSNSDFRPPVIQDLGNGSYYYNYNIHEVESAQEDNVGKSSFICDSVLVWGKPTYQKVMKEILRETLSESDEFNLVNKYNAYINGLSDNKEDKDTYIDYLRFVRETKDVVKKDFSNGCG